MDIADIRLQNVLLLKDHSERKWRSEGDERARTTEASFAKVIGIKPSYWSQLKSKHRHISAVLARQIERNCRVPLGSLDSPSAERLPVSVLPPSVPFNDDEERHAVQLFLVAYRMNKQAAKERLLDVLQGELLKQSVTVGRTKKTTAVRPSVVSLKKRA